MKRIYFNIRQTARERMWDTVQKCNDLCEVLLPSRITKRSSVEVYTSHQTFRGKLLNTLKLWLSKHMINIQRVDLHVAKKADLVYMWGAFPKNYSGKYVIELDNPFVLAYYYPKNFWRNKEKIEGQLNEAYKIIFMSDTAKNHTIQIFGKWIEEKSYILYPYMDRNYVKRKESNKKKKEVNLCFVGLNSRLKGLPELLEAFHHTSFKNVNLYVVSPLNSEEKRKYTNDQRIKFLDPQPREVLINKLYPEMDVFIFPSLYESFGVVLLEALSFGMGVITTNVYATPEMVINNLNGRLLHHPFIRPSNLNGRDVINCVELRLEKFHDKYLSNNEFYYSLYRELKEAIYEAVESYDVWQKNSIELFEEKFSPDVWKYNMKKILEI